MGDGKRLGDYELLELIGKGGHGRVYKALDTRLRRIVAIKVVSPRDDVHGRRQLADFTYEARIASSLNHPNICTVYSLVEDEDRAYMVMEYVDGKNLYELAYGRPLEIASALRIAIQIAGALVAAHASGVIHRDIKPRNVMVTTGGQAIVLDFGLAKLLERPDGTYATGYDEDAGTNFDSDDSLFADIAESLFVTPFGVPQGTPATSAPEMALGKATDHRSDIFSTGVLLYLLLTGKYPFIASTKAEVRRKVINDDPMPVTVARESGPPIPLSLVAIVRRSLRKEPDERYGTMAEMRDALVAVLDEVEPGSGSDTPDRDPVAAVQRPVAYAPDPPASMKRSVVLAVTVTIVTLLLIIVWLVNS